MAKVVGPLQSSEARGKMSGLIYNTWRGLSVVKRFVSPAQPRTARQLTIRARTLTAVRAWQGLSAANRAAWDDYAVAHPDSDWTGSNKRLTGANWFVRCSVRLLDLALAIVNSPPLTVSPDPPVAFAAADGVGSSALTWTSTGGTDKMLDYFVQGPHSPGLLAKLEQAVHAQYRPAEGGAYTHVPDVVGTYTFFARIIDEDNGLASSWVQDTAVIT